MAEHRYWPIFSTENWKNCIYFGGLRKTGLLSDTETLCPNTAKFQSYRHCPCQGVNNILVPKSDQ